MKSSNTKKRKAEALEWDANGLATIKPFVSKKQRIDDKPPPVLVFISASPTPFLNMVTDVRKAHFYPHCDVPILYALALTCRVFASEILPGLGLPAAWKKQVENLELSVPDPWQPAVRCGFQRVVHDWLRPLGYFDKVLDAGKAAHLTLDADFNFNASHQYYNPFIPHYPVIADTFTLRLYSKGNDVNFNFTFDNVRKDTTLGLTLEEVDTEELQRVVDKLAMQQREKADITKRRNKVNPEWRTELHHLKQARGDQKVKLKNYLTSLRHRTNWEQYEWLVTTTERASAAARQIVEQTSRINALDILIENAMAEQEGEKEEEEEEEKGEAMDVDC